MINRLRIAVFVALAVSACANPQPSIVWSEVPATELPSTQGSPRRTIGQPASPEPRRQALAERETRRESVRVDDEVAVRIAHRTFLVDVYRTDGRIAGSHGRLPLAEQHVLDPQLQRLRDLADRYAASGRYAISPGYESHVVEVTMSGGTAWVVDCSRDRGELFSATGEVLLAADDFFKLRQTELVRVDERWMVREFYTGGDVQCDPADYR